MKPKPDTAIHHDDRLKRATKLVRRVFQEAWNEYHQYKPDNTGQLAASRAPAFEVGETANQRKLERARLLLEQSTITDASGDDFDMSGPGPSSTSHSQSLIDDANATYAYDARDDTRGTTRCGVDSEFQPTKGPLERRLIATHSPNAPPKYDWCTFTNLSVKSASELSLPFLPYSWPEKLLAEHLKSFEQPPDNTPSMVWLAAYRRPHGKCLTIPPYRRARAVQFTAKETLADLTRDVSIMLETVKRLFSMKLDKHMIDRTRVLSRGCQELLDLEPWLPAFPTPSTSEWTTAPRIVKDEIKSKESKDADGYYCCVPGGGFFCHTHCTFNLAYHAAVDIFTRSAQWAA